MTCMHACGALAEGVPWLKGDGRQLQGCGANMRVGSRGHYASKWPTVGSDYSGGSRPVSGGIDAWPSHRIGRVRFDGCRRRRSGRWRRSGGLPGRLREYARTQRNLYHADWIDVLWQRPGTTCPSNSSPEGGENVWPFSIALTRPWNVPIGKPIPATPPAKVGCRRGVRHGLAVLPAVSERSRRGGATGRRDSWRFRFHCLSHRRLRRSELGGVGVAEPMDGTDRVPRSHRSPWRGMGLMQRLSIGGSVFVLWRVTLR